MKRCIACKINKRNSEFYKDPAKKDGLKNECKPCYNLRCGEYSLKAKYNLTKDERQAMIDSQNGCCAICQKPFESSNKTHVDHCHTTGKVRNILCGNCNSGLGMFKDDPNLLTAAIQYVEYHATEITTTSISKRDYRESEVNSLDGSVSTTGAGQDDDNAYHHCGTISREDLDHRPQTSSGDSVGHRGEEMATPIYPKGFKDPWEHPTTIIGAKD